MQQTRRTMDRTVEAENTPHLYNDVSRPRNNIVEIDSATRHAMLCSMFPQWTPMTERVVDYLMGLSDKQFQSLCEQHGSVVVMNHAALERVVASADTFLQTPQRPRADFDPDDDDGIEMELELAGLTTVDD